MDFALNEDQLELQEMVREFVNKEITPFAGEMDRNNEAMPGLMEKAADMGLLNLIVPEEYGGPGLDSVTVAMIYEELGKGCAGIATSMAANSLAGPASRLEPLELFHSQVQHRYAIYPRENPATRHDPLGY